MKLGLKEVERQRYRCKNCRKTFTDVTSTPFYRTHKPDKWLDFIKCMLEGYSLRKSAELEGRKSRKRGGSSKFRGISHEQVCVLIARDRQKSTYSGILGRGRIVKAKLDKAIGSKLSSNNTLCTDAWRAFSAYAKSKGLEHYRFKSDGAERVKGL